MKSFRIFAWAGIAGVYALALLTGAAPLSAQTAPSLRIEQLKITSDDQFVTLANHTASAVDISAYELIYFNTDNKPTKTFTFSGTIAPGGYYVMSDALLTVCHNMQIEAVSLGFSTTAGSLQLWKYTTAANKTLESSAAWIKTRKADTPSSTVTLPAAAASFLQRKALPGDEWLTVQPSAADPCQLEAFLPAPQAEEPNFYFLPSMMPPVSYVAAPAEGGSGLTNRNPGKMAPVINELLPNPGDSQSDAEDEFIELYNPNDSVFDLSGFKLAFGSTAPKKYTFPEGTILGPKEFRAFTSGGTSISLSNTLAQVWLLAPNEQVIGESKLYQAAKDGQAWALNNGEWLWTSSPSPNAANTLSAAAGTAAKAKATAAVLGISTGGAAGSGASTTVASAANPAVLDDAPPLHPVVLAGVGALALGYALYEYRHDVSNRVFQFRRYLRLRRATR